MNRCASDSQSRNEDAFIRVDLSVPDRETRADGGSVPTCRCWWRPPEISRNLKNKHGSVGASHTRDGDLPELRHTLTCFIHPRDLLDLSVTAGGQDLDETRLVGSCALRTRGTRTTWRSEETWRDSRRSDTGVSSRLLVKVWCSRCVLNNPFTASLNTDLNSHD